MARAVLPRANKVKDGVLKAVLRVNDWLSLFFVSRVELSKQHITTWQPSWPIEGVTVALKSNRDIKANPKHTVGISRFFSQAAMERQKPIADYYF
jgi:negative regulator of sigma E activity